MRHLLGTLLLLGSLACQAAEFHLKDGTIVVGTIINLADGEDLIVDTEYMDEVTIEWDAVSEIRGTQLVEVEFFSGKRVIGTVQFDGDQMIVRGDDEIDVDPEEVFAISEVNETFWEAIDIYTDLGMNLVRGNNQVTQLSVGAGIAYDGIDFEVSLSGTTILNEQIEAPDTRRNTLSGNYTYKLPRNWTLTGIYQFESDQQQNLDGRTLFGGAVGQRIINGRRHRIELFGGLAMNSEKFADTERVETPEGLIGGIYRMRTAVDIDAALTLFPNLEESGRLRSQFDASLSIDLWRDLDFKVTVYDRYDSDPPPGNVKNDSGLTLGLSWEL